MAIGTALSAGIATAGAGAGAGALSGGLGSSLSAIAGVSSPFVQGGFGLIQQNQAYKQNKALMWRQAVYNNLLNSIQWEREMQASNTAYRRAVYDLKKAGLNPILAVHGMSGSSTPNMGAPSVSGHSAISAGSISPLTLNIMDALESASRIEANTALKAKYDAEAKLTDARVPFERAKSILGQEAEGGYNVIKTFTSKFGERVGKLVGDFLFNSPSKHHIINSQTNSAYKGSLGKNPRFEIDPEGRIIIIKSAK